MYAFGVLMWEIFHGKRAWEGLNHAQVPSLSLASRFLQLPRMSFLLSQLRDHRDNVCSILTA